jgi:hypothetical protein
VSVDDEEHGWSLYLTGEARLSACPGVKRLMSYCQTEPQRRFFELWCHTFIYPLREGWNAGADYSPEWSERALDLRYAFPALIPEVWLNYLGPRKSADDELHLAENPSRVDFVMLSGGTKCVIEIDGKSHYADYNQDANRWVPDERRYTRNLKIERSLRRQGWEIHRFSDLEVNACKPDEFWSLVIDLPGVMPPS